jgi:cysteinyl-tRNA synthetase
VRIYDTLARGLVELPKPPGPVRMYFCGPTVYQRIHVGNAVPFVLPLWLARWLQRKGYETKLVINITDINDKIYDAAPGASARLAEDATRWYVEDTDRLGLGRPDVEPTAVDTVADQIAMIEELVEQGYAYESGGDVYFRVARFAEYGGLSGQRPEEVQEQEPNPRKEDPRDFALWKANKPGEDTWWESPWGGGRPGWHIECSVMSEKHLGPEFEIHGGGLDLVFPHHENERAQSGALGHRFARIWMHNGMLEFGGAEMHKSVGNDVSLKDALDRWGRETLLVFFLTGHWRKPLEYSDATLNAAAARAERFRDVFRAPSEAARNGAWERFAAALDDDFNTPEALAVMHEWRDHELLRRALDVFGLASLAEQESAPAEVVSLAERRRDARSAGDFAAADRLREELAAAGWDVRDVAGEPGFQLVPRA